MGWYGGQATCSGSCGIPSHGPSHRRTANVLRSQAPARTERAPRLVRAQDTMARTRLLVAAGYRAEDYR